MSGRIRRGCRGSNRIPSNKPRRRLQSLGHGVGGSPGKALGPQPKRDDPAAKPKELGLPRTSVRNLGISRKPRRRCAVPRPAWGHSAVDSPPAASAPVQGTDAPPRARTSTQPIVTDRIRNNAFYRLTSNPRGGGVSAPLGVSSDQQTAARGHLWSHHRSSRIALLIATRCSRNRRLAHPAHAAASRSSTS